jgi:outer membrane lipase/esterase
MHIINNDKSANNKSVLPIGGTLFNNRIWPAACAAVMLLFANAAFAAPPVAVDDTRTIPANTSVTLNPLINDYDPDGDRIVVVSVGAASNGTTTLNPDGSIRYVPEAGFTGVDQFSYTIMEETEEAHTASATVTIHVMEERLMDRLTSDNLRSLGQSLDTVCTTLREIPDDQLSNARRDLLQRCNALDTLTDPSQLNDIWRQIAPEEAVAQLRVAADASRIQLNAVNQRLQQIQSGGLGYSVFSLNGIALAETGASGGGASGDQSIWSRFGTFLTVQYDGAERDMTELENGYDYSALSFTAGVDYRLDAERVAGIALGRTRNDLKYSNQAGNLETDIISLIVFGSRQKGRFAIDMQLGYAETQFESRRHIQYSENAESVDVTLRGATSGSQWLFNTQIQWEWHRDALSLYPFARVDYLRNSTRGYGEQGDSGLAMAFSRQSMQQVTVVTGVQGTYAISRSWGVLIPSVELALLGDAHSDFDPVTARFAYDPDPGNSFNLRNDGGESRYGQVTLGTSALFARGASAFLQYRQLVSYSNLSAYQIQAGIRYEL